ncbi:hypothetical protein DQ238_18290 [Geodermatophilus sp. TF02-6]|uniref:hypothetical protein n=1 Tax=Geodermatophilus sp. TF02-6 TaxID=2250575 RepID=UPI000DEAA2B7|nr:hypothetical protein [Geodermatophilus sp. TF02-6]RBY76106.1 hypothetical protein DQ238_18290 [Geodermatophilus sp. TF02-6]
MSTTDGWDFTVPDDEAELLAELRRHGVTPGERFRLIHSPAPTGEVQPAPERPRCEELSFIGSVKGGPRDMARNTDAYLAGFGE